jgi:mono/diheme cytochrome c family protein
LAGLLNLLSLQGGEAASNRPLQEVSIPRDIDAGKRIFANYCAACHGREGRGDGPIAGTVRPKPFDFSNQAAMDAKRDLDLYLAIFGGGKAMGKSPFMPGWGGLLKEQQIWDIIAYVRTLSQQPSLRPIFPTTVQVNRSPSC